MAENDDRDAILSRRSFLIRSTLISAGLVAAATPAFADVEPTEDAPSGADEDVEVTDTEADTEPQVCLSMEKPEEDCSCETVRAQPKGEGGSWIAPVAGLAAVLVARQGRDQGQ